MLSVANRFVVFLTYPPNLSLCLILLGVLAWAVHRRMLGGALLAFACAWSLLWSVPQVSDWLRLPLVRQHPVVAATVLPEAGAIVVLGGGSLHPDYLHRSRLAAAARAWRTGRAPVVILSGGRGGHGRSEAERMREAIVTLGVPDSVLVLEERSRDTRENALFTAKLAQARSIRRVLLVTSSMHMPRASLLFRAAGLDVTPMPVSEHSDKTGWRDRWLPTRRALWRSGRTLKEYAGLLAIRTAIVEPEMRTGV